MTPRETYIAYLLVKVDEEDWHGVSDAANDLRELDARDRTEDRVFIPAGNTPLQMKDLDLRERIPRK